MKFRLIMYGFICPKIPKISRNSILYFICKKLRDFFVQIVIIEIQKNPVKLKKECLFFYGIYLSKNTKNIP